MQGGSVGTIAILAALHERGRTGKGAELDLSLYEAGLFCAALRHGIGEYTDPRAHIWPVNDLFETADGSVLILGIVEQHFRESFRAAVGDLAPALADSKFDTDHSRRSRSNGVDMEFSLSEELQAIREANAAPSSTPSARGCSPAAKWRAFTA